MTADVRMARSARGFTLVELIVVLGLMAIIGGIVATSVSRGLRADAQARSRIEAFEDMQVAMERMSRDIRAADPIQVAEDNLIEVQVRREDSCHLFTYEYDPIGEDLTATEQLFESDCSTATGTSGPRILLSGLANDDVDTVFTYWDAERDQPLDVDDIGFTAATPEYVEISFVHPLALDQRPVTVSTVVGLRNR